MLGPVSDDTIDFYTSDPDAGDQTVTYVLDAAANHVVVNDVGDDPARFCDFSYCDLRGAIRAINSAGGAFGTQEINFGGVPPTSTVTLLNGEYVISQPTFILGGGTITLNGNATSRLFTNNSTLTLQGLILGNGAAAGDGGAIYNNGSLTLGDSRIHTSNASGNGGAIYNAGGTLTLRNTLLDVNAASGGGGAVFINAGSVDLNTNSAVIQNTAVISGGGLYNLGGNLTVEGTTTINTNVASSGTGGGIKGAFSTYNGAPTFTANFPNDTAP
jgi:hypothetical protein